MKWAGFASALLACYACSKESPITALEPSLLCGSLTSTDPANRAPMGTNIDVTALPLGSSGKGYVDLSTAAPADIPPPPATDGVGAFRSVCDYSHMGFDDPIVFPNQAGASHLHTFFGNTGINAASTAESIRTTGNSTCRGGIINRSGYWVPTLLDPNGVPQAPVAAHVYYKSGYYGIEPSKITKFPQGLRMIAGNAKAAPPLEQEVANWGCVNNYIGHFPYIPNCRTDDQIEMNIHFPQCWNGKDLDSADHKSHMAYPVSNKCPATHPVAIPAIEIHVRYKMSATGSMKGWHLASDLYDPSLPGGYSAHGDWFEGWDPDIVKTFVDNCINPGRDCHSHLLGDGRQMN